MSDAAVIERLDSALVETSDRALIYAQIIEFAVNEFKYMGALSDDAETKARAKAAALYITTRTEALGN